MLLITQAPPLDSHRIRRPFSNCFIRARPRPPPDASGRSQLQLVGQSDSQAFALPLLSAPFNA